jgi:hypothetical protein
MKTRRVILLILTLGLLSGAAWAHVARVDTVVRAAGRVRPIT